MSLINIVIAILSVLAASNKILATNQDEFKKPFPPIKPRIEEASGRLTGIHSSVNTPSQTSMDQSYIENGLSCIDQDKFDEAETTFKKVLELKEYSDPRSSAHTVYTSLFQLGEINFIRANFDAALRYYKEALFIPWAGKDHSQIFSAIGDAYLKINKFQDAIKSYNFSMIFRENDLHLKATIYQKLVDVHCLDNNCLEAVIAYKNAIELLHQLYINNIENLTKKHETVGLLCTIFDDYCCLTISPEKTLMKKFYDEEFIRLKNQINSNKLR